MCVDVVYRGGNLPIEFKYVTFKDNLVWGNLYQDTCGLEQR